VGGSRIVDLKGKEMNEEHFTVHDEVDWRFDTDEFKTFAEASTFAEGHNLTEITAWIEGEEDNGPAASLRYREGQWYDVTYYDTHSKLRLWVRVT